MQERGSGASCGDGDHSSCNSDDAVGDSDDVDGDSDDVVGDSDDESTRTLRDILKYDHLCWVMCHDCNQWRMLPSGTSDGFVKNIPHPWRCGNK